MRSVDVDRVVAAAVAGSDSAWGSIVDSNVDRMWQRAVAEGLSASDAAQVCQLAWLRLGQRLHTLASLAEVAQWLGEQVAREAAALAAQREAREQRAVPDNVVYLRSGFVPAPRAETPADRGMAYVATARQAVCDVRAGSADASSAPL